MNQKRRKTDSIEIVSLSTFNIKGMEVNEFIDFYGKNLSDAYKRGGLGEAYKDLIKTTSTGYIKGFSVKEKRLIEKFETTPFFTIIDDSGNKKIIDLST